MKKVVIFFLILILIALPVAAFSINDFLTDFKEKLSITGFDAVQFSPTPACTEDETKCGTGNDCNGNPCILKCQDEEWIEWSYCNYQCENAVCIESPQNEETTFTDPEEEGEITTQITCSDGTNNNQCSTDKPYFCSEENLIQDCITCGCPSNNQCTNNQCVENEPYDPGGEEEDDPNLLNMPPVIFPIKEQITKIGETFTFEIKAIDVEGDQLSFYFKEQKNKIIKKIVECSILNNIVSCSAIKEGEDNLEIIVYDKKEEVKTTIKIKVLKKLLPKSEKGIAAGLINTPPIADAGMDIIGTPGAPIILDASLSFDKEGIPSIDESYKWYENNQRIAIGKTVEKTFELGTHSVTLEVTDSEGITATDTINIIMEPRETCKNTQTRYYPKDTICNSAWPAGKGDTFKINSINEACNLFEVCDESVDPIIEESIKCCTEGLTDPIKAATCNFANENSETFKNCQAIYIINGIGGSEIYMKGYFDAEMCCKGVDVLCPNEDYLYTANPLPSQLKRKGLKCSNTPENNPNGIWKSDTNTALNEIALADLPSHVNLNELGTGTCVDYSVSATTLLRKIGFSKENVFTIEASDHAYNMIRFDLDKKFTIFDGTGNNRGLRLGYVPQGYDYCAKTLNCYNDMGKTVCPSNKEIFGCENTEENIGRTTGRQVEGVKGTLQGFWDKIWGEIIR